MEAVISIYASRFTCVHIAYRYHRGGKINPEERRSIPARMRSPVGLKLLLFYRTPPHPNQCLHELWFNLGVHEGSGWDAKLLSRLDCSRCGLCLLAHSLL